MPTALHIDESDSAGAARLLPVYVRLVVYCHLGVCSVDRAVVLWRTRGFYRLSQVCSGRAFDSWAGAMCLPGSLLLCYLGGRHLDDEDSLNAFGCFVFKGRLGLLMLSAKLVWGFNDVIICLVFFGACDGSCATWVGGVGSVAGSEVSGVLFVGFSYGCRNCFYVGFTNVLDMADESEPR